MSSAAWADALLQAAGWQVLYSSLVAGLVVLVLRIHRKASAGLRLALWSLVLVRLVVPPDLAAPWSARSLLASVEPWLVPGAGGTDVSKSAVSTLPTATARFELPAGAESAAGGLSWQAVVVALWACGALYFLVRLARRRRKFRRLVANAQPLAGDGLRELVESWRHRLGIGREVEIVVSGEATTPFTLGLLRPRIFLPRILLDQHDAGLVESVLAHELAHVRRFDDGLLLACRTLECLYFFHPVVWIATRRISDQAEQLCDAAVLGPESPITSRAYGRGLLAVLRLNLRTAEPLPSFGDHSRSLQMRFRRILSGDARPSRGGTLFSAAFALLFSLFVLPLGPLQGAPAAAASGDDPPVAEGQPVTDESREQMRERLEQRLREQAATEATGTAEPTSAEATSAVVIVHAEHPLDSISRQELAELFVKETTQWSTGEPVEPVDLPPDFAARTAFSQGVLGKAPDEIMAYWQRRIFDGRGVPPIQLRTEAAVIDHVREHRNAVGYVGTSTPLPPGVKVLAVTEG